MVQSNNLNTDTQIPLHINRKHKDSLFRIAFREKEALLELYNALNDSDYKDPAEVKIYTMEDVIFMGIKNDISFLVGEMLNLYEHQSTRNPNMPIRGLIYFAKNYEHYITKNDLDIFSSTLQKLPFPQYYILYNGEKDEADRKVIELKDAFPDLTGRAPCLNCTATLLNINYGHNQKLMERSRTLRDYSIFIQRIRDSNHSGLSLHQAVDKATEDCIREGILKDILLKNSAEVKTMVLGTWGTENHIRKQEEERERLKQKCKELEHKRTKLENKTSELIQTNSELTQAKFELTQTNSELTQANSELTQANSELTQTNSELTQTNSELTQTNSELTQVNCKLIQTNKKIEKMRNAENILTLRLLHSGKLEELNKSLTDDIYRKKLLKEYNLI